MPLKRPLVPVIPNFVRKIPRSSPLVLWIFSCLVCGEFVSFSLFINFPEQGRQYEKTLHSHPVPEEQRANSSHSFPLASAMPKTLAVDETENGRVSDVVKQFFIATPTPSLTFENDSSKKVSNRTRTKTTSYASTSSMVVPKPN
jgi:hypothetical protein